MSRKVIAPLVGVALVAVAVAGAPLAPALARPLTSDDAALGGVELVKPVSLPADGKFRTVLTIKGVRFGSGEDARALLWGVLSMRNNAAAGSARVKARMAVNGVPEEHVFSQTVVAKAYASHPIPCDAIAAAGQTYDYALQVAVIGSGPLVVGAGTFDLVAFRPIFNPPP
jgi:hypothetical protein